MEAGRWAKGIIDPWKQYPLVPLIIQPNIDYLIDPIKDQDGILYAQFFSS